MRIEVSINIARPPEVVWRTIADVQRWHEWTPSIRSIEPLDSFTFGVGSRFRIRQPKLKPMVWRVTEVEPGRSFTWETLSPGMVAIGRHMVRPNGNGSTATLVLIQEGWLSALLRPLLAPISRRYVEMEARGLKRQCELS
jgi:uncharacterized protein YndB with AHSA1/START domain